jgi:hypothetical protein
MLLAEIFGREDFIRAALFKKKTAARNFSAGDCSGGCH